MFCILIVEYLQLWLCLSEGTRDVAFECKGLSRYGNWNLRKQLKFAYLNCDVIDRLGLTIVTVNLKSVNYDYWIRKDHLENGSRMVRPFGLHRERCNIPMDPQNLGYLSSPLSFASFAFACRRESRVVT